jgi:hypothetical protein
LNQSTKPHMSSWCIDSFVIERASDRYVEIGANELFAHLARHQIAKCCIGAVPSALFHEEDNRNTLVTARYG